MKYVKIVISSVLIAIGLTISVASTQAQIIQQAQAKYNCNEDFSVCRRGGKLEGAKDGFGQHVTRDECGSLSSFSGVSGDHISCERTGPDVDCKVVGDEGNKP